MNPINLFSYKPNGDSTTKKIDFSEIRNNYESIVSDIDKIKKKYGLELDISNSTKKRNSKAYRESLGTNKYTTEDVNTKVKEFENKYSDLTKRILDFNASLGFKNWSGLKPDSINKYNKIINMEPKLNDMYTSLESKGYEPGAIYGILANLAYESDMFTEFTERGKNKVAPDYASEDFTVSPEDFKPGGKYNGTGFGMAQWTNSRGADFWKYIYESGLDTKTVDGKQVEYYNPDKALNPKDYETQKQYLLNELDKSRGVWNKGWTTDKFKYALDPYAATKVYTVANERPSASSAEIPKRLDLAEMIAEAGSYDLSDYKKSNDKYSNISNQVYNLAKYPEGAGSIVKMGYNLQKLPPETLANLNKGFKEYSPFTTSDGTNITRNKGESYDNYFDRIQDEYGESAKNWAKAESDKYSHNKDVQTALGFSEPDGMPGTKSNARYKVYESMYKDKINNPAPSSSNNFATGSDGIIDFLKGLFNKGEKPLDAPITTKLDTPDVPDIYSISSKVDDIKNKQLNNIKNTVDNELNIKNAEFDSTGLMQLFDSVSKVGSNVYVTNKELSDTGCAGSSNYLSCLMNNENYTPKDAKNNRIFGVNAWQLSNNAGLNSDNIEEALKSPYNQRWSYPSFFDLGEDYTKDSMSNKDRFDKYKQFLSETNKDGITNEDLMAKGLKKSIDSGVLEVGDLITLFDKKKYGWLNDDKYNDANSHVVTFMGVNPDTGELMIADSYKGSGNYKIKPLDSERYAPTAVYEDVKTNDNKSQLLNELSDMFSKKKNTKASGSTTLNSRRPFEDILSNLYPLGDMTGPPEGVPRQGLGRGLGPGATNPGMHAAMVNEMRDRNSGLNIPEDWVGKSPADIAKKIQNKYKDAPRNSIAYNAMMDELESLAEFQTSLKSSPQGQMQERRIQQSMANAGLSTGNTMAVGTDPIKKIASIDTDISPEDVKEAAFNRYWETAKTSGIPMSVARTSFNNKWDRDINRNNNELDEDLSGLSTLVNVPTTDLSSQDIYDAVAKSIGDVNVDIVKDPSKFKTITSNIGNSLSDLFSGLSGMDKVGLYSGAEALANVAGNQYLKNQLIKPERIDPREINPQYTKSDFDISGILNQATSQEASNLYNLRKAGGTLSDVLKGMMSVNQGTNKMVTNAYNTKAQFDASENAKFDSIVNKANEANVAANNLADRELDAKLNEYNKEKRMYDLASIQSGSNFMRDMADKNYSTLLEKIKAKTAAISKIS